EALLHLRLENDHLPPSRSALASRRHRYINGTHPSWLGRGDLGCAVDGERGGRVAAKADRRCAGKIGAGDGYAGAPRRRTGIWIDVGDGGLARLRLSFAFEANCA